jgi:hypothetical protein
MFEELSANPELISPFPTAPSGIDLQSLPFFANNAEKRGE